mgnify:CR=1 FL=1
MTYIVNGIEIEPEARRDKSVWIRYMLGSGQITDRQWLIDYKQKLHPHDDWTCVDVDTYAWNLCKFDLQEVHNIIDAAMKAKVVGYLD